MITEDYVSFEVARLLKEKGFNECIFEFYEGNKIKYAHNGKGFRLSELGSDIYYPHITLQMAMKWLREVHNVVIVIDVCRETGREGFYCWQLEDNHTGDNIVNIVGECSTYEQACEEAIKYYLKNIENLI